MADRPALLELVDLFARLRRECAWKAAQTHRSLSRYLLEESYETVEAIDAGDPDLLREELGDLLLQVYLHAAIAEQAGDFTLEEVAAGLRDKMIRRNPHVFGGPGDIDGEAPTDPAAVDELWQRVKAGEKRREQVMAGVPVALPALLRADKLLERMERAGRPVRPDPRSDDPGERLLAVVAELRAEGVDPEAALRDAVRRHESA
ncbi:MAG: MazG family protein [Marmoricola sp.]